MDIEKELHSHFEEDKKNFTHIDTQFVEQNKILNALLEGQKKTHEFMESMDGINDVVKGTRLLKTPILWVVAFVVGIVALMGGMKTIIGWFITK